MDAVFYLYNSLVFISGVFIGSFLNVVADRLEKGGPILVGRSKCEFCDHELGPKELIPVASFVAQGGKCSKCKVSLSILYPISELLTGAVFVAVAIWLKVFVPASTAQFITFAFYLVISAFLIIIFLSDLKYMIVPDKIVFPAIGLAAIYQIGMTIYASYDLYVRLSSDPFGKYLLKAGLWKNQSIYLFSELGILFLSGLGIALFFLLLIAITKGRGMGFGDVKLGFLVGLMAGFQNSLVLLFTSFLLGALMSIVLILVKRKTMKDAVPFGPFIITAFYISIFFGNFLVQSYLKMLH